jgi:DNA-binding transcriptional MocR family regulator
MPNENPKIEVRDLRHGEWFWIDKAIVKEYVKKIGAVGIIVYTFLAAYADKKQSCFPSQKYIAEHIGYSRATVNKAVKKLEGYKLVKKGKKDRHYCKYLLLEIPRCKAEETKVSTTGNSGVKQRNTNKNYITRNNNNVNEFKKILYSKPPENLKEGNPKTREECLAWDLAEALYDKRSLGVYLAYAKKYPEQLLRTVLSEVKEMALDDQIKKSRAALFTHILKKHVQETTNNTGD